ncbi:MAG: DUF4350 domain-containing protein [Pyrinomonadaceae bacterium]
MKQRIGIILTVVLVLGVLIAINAVSYQREDEQQDTELLPNRSTYHAGATGTRALYDFLSESGYPVMRWREVPAQLLAETRQRVQTFVIIGHTTVPIEEDEVRSLLLWVERGGTLVLVDRDTFLSGSGGWEVSPRFGEFPSFSINPGDVGDMTENVKPMLPVQPTLLTQNVESVMPSRFAARMTFTRTNKDPEQSAYPAQPEPESDDVEYQPTPTPESVGPSAGGPTQPTQISPAPVVHLEDSRGALLIDYPRGNGRIAILSDPYIFSNGGLSLRDNLQLAINLVNRNGGLIAFDEYHHGKVTTRNDLFGYFSGTPILPILGQLAALILVILWTSSRRFARPLPLKEIDRRSSLEFVASMAELQQRARAFDLAIENVYSRTRRVLARYAGMEYNSPRAVVAEGVAARSSLDARPLEALMRQCEEAINGAPVTERQSILLVRRLREVERALGLRMRARDARQAIHKV